MMIIIILLIIWAFLYCTDKDIKNSSKNLFRAIFKKLRSILLNLTKNDDNQGESNN